MVPSVNQDLSIIKTNNNRVQNNDDYLNNMLSVKTYEQIILANGLKKDLIFYLNSLWKQMVKKLHVFCNQIYC